MLHKDTFDNAYHCVQVFRNARLLKNALKKTIFSHVGLDFGAKQMNEFRQVLSWWRQFDLNFIIISGKDVSRGSVGNSQKDTH